MNVRASEAAVVLENPKYPHNVGGALRACAAFGAPRLYWTGERVFFKPEHLPGPDPARQRRQSVRFAREPEALDRLIARGFVPVAVELKPDAENLVFFAHPEKAAYVFGPEDGSLSKDALRRCHRFVSVPTHYCLNLAATVNVVLYDRRVKAMLAGSEPVLPLSEMLRREMPEIAISGRVRDGFEGR